MFGFIITGVGSPDFDLIAIWAQIEAIRPDESSSPQYPDVLIARCTPDPRIDELRRARRKKQLIGAGAFLVAIIIAAPGFLSSEASIAIVAIAIGVIVALWKKANFDTGEFSRTHNEAVRNFEAANARWSNVQKLPNSFNESKRRLESQRAELQQLPTMRTQRLAELQGNLRRKQLQKWLELHRIEDATIPNIGPGRKNTLRAYGVEDASDVHLSLEVKGFGPSLISALCSWRAAIERRFVFNPNEGIDPADHRSLDAEIAQKRSALIQSISAGPRTLKQIVLSWKIDHDAALANVNQWSSVVAQAELNLKHLRRW
jgi:hypothetical protein